jgi:hypothetical protein
MGRMIEGLLQPTHILILFPLFALLALLPLWRILAKAGYPGPISLLALIPLVGIVIDFWLAFSEWPLERAAKQKDIPVLTKYCSACGKPV